MTTLAHEEQHVTTAEWLSEIKATGLSGGLVVTSKEAIENEAHEFAIHARSSDAMDPGAVRLLCVDLKDEKCPSATVKSVKDGLLAAAEGIAVWALDTQKLRVRVRDLATEVGMEVTVAGTPTLECVHCHTLRIWQAGVLVASMVASVGPGLQYPELSCLCAAEACLLHIRQDRQVAATADDGTSCMALEGGRPA